MKKTLLVLFLALTMVFCFGTAALAAETVEVGTEGELINAFANATAGDTVKLTDGIVLSNGIAVEDGKDIILDLNGYEITDEKYFLTETNRVDYLFAVNHGGKLTVDDSSSDKEGAITSTYNTVVIKLTTETNDSKKAELIIENGILTAEKYVISGNGNAGRGNTAVTINGGQMISETGVAVYQPQRGTLIISGGTIKGATAVYVKSGSLKINGGTIIGIEDPARDFVHTDDGTNVTGDAIVIEACGYPGGNPKAEISGGDISSAAGNAVATYEDGEANEAPEGFISGGKFSGAQAPAADLFESGCSLNTNGTVVERSASGLKVKAAALSTPAKDKAAVTITDSTEGYVYFRAVENAPSAMKINTKLSSVDEWTEYTEAKMTADVVNGYWVEAITVESFEDEYRVSQWGSVQFYDGYSGYIITFDLNGGKIDGSSADITVNTKTNGKLAASSFPDDPSRSNYKFKGWFTSRTGGTKVTTSTEFDSHDTVYAQWSAYRDIDVDDDIAHGSLIVKPEDPAAGEEVAIVVIPDAGYELASLIVTDDDGDKVTVKLKSGNTYSFTMPDDDVEITAVFRPITVVLPFTDVSYGDWFYNAVHYNYVTGIMDGVGGNKFAPYGNLTRGMMVTMLYRMAGEPYVAGSAGYADVPVGQWYSAAVRWAEYTGITNGYGNGIFGLNDYISREQMASMLFRYACYYGYDNGGRASLAVYNDAAQISSWAKDALAWASYNGVINGKPGAVIDPQGFAIRADVAQMFMNFQQNIIK